MLKDYKTVMKQNAYFVVRPSNVLTAVTAVGLAVDPCLVEVVRVGEVQNVYAEHCTLNSIGGLV